MLNKIALALGGLAIVFIFLIYVTMKESIRLENELNSAIIKLEQSKARLAELECKLKQLKERE